MSINNVEFCRVRKRINFKNKSKLKGFDLNKVNAIKLMSKDLQISQRKDGLEGDC